ncbi:MAG: RNA polymerase sigma factor [bacterium]|nr:RNA polymerase sigma factor [bacterium]
MPAGEHATVTDESLVACVRSGDTVAYGSLMERYMARMQRYIRKFLFGHEDAEDIAQEVFTKAYVHLNQFDASRSFSTWLYRIAHNECINAIKRKQREPIPFFDPDTLFPHPVARETPRDHVERVELRMLVETSLEQLAPKYREPVVLYYFEERSYREIADIMRIPVATVGVRLARARTLLAAAHVRDAAGHP